MALSFTLFTLDNGLRVAHHPDTATPMASLTLLYDVGARDESPALTGLAHLFEHLMFGGSAHIPQFDKPLEAAGGWSNAWTGNDCTCFYEAAPAVNIDTLFWLESDRMLSLAFSPRALEVQRKVVLEEFSQTCLNSPYGDMAHHLRAMAYTRHPYRWPVIGLEPSHISRVTAADVEAFYYSHYAPNNAVLVVSGNVSLERTRALAERWFGPIPRRSVAPRTYGPEPPQTAPREAVVSGRVPQAVVTVAYHMDGFGTRAYHAADAITDLLSVGRSSRFYRNLVLADPLFASADASIIGSREPGLLMLNAAITRPDEASARLAARRLADEARRLADEGPTDHEVARTLARVESQEAFASISYLHKGRALAQHIMHSPGAFADGPCACDPRAIYRTLTASDIRDTAASVLDPSGASTLIYLPAS